MRVSLDFVGARSARAWAVVGLLVGCGGEPPPLPQDPYPDAGPCGRTTLSWLDMQHDPAHCGSCGNACGEGARCVQGACLSAPPVAPYTACGDDPRLCLGECTPVGAAPPVCIPLCGFDHDCPASPLGAGTRGVCLLDTGRCGLACGPDGACPAGQTCGARLHRAPGGDVRLCAP